MVTGGNTALDPSQQSYQLQREGSLAYKEPPIIAFRQSQQPSKRANTAAESGPPVIKQSYP